MSDTPRTDRARLDEHDPAVAVASECSKLERELSVANDRIKRLEEARTVAAANSLANMISYENAITKIKRLEEGGDEAICPFEYAARVRIWTEAKEANL